MNPKGVATVHAAVAEVVAGLDCEGRGGTRGRLRRREKKSKQGVGAGVGYAVWEKMRKTKVCG